MSRRQPRLPEATEPLALAPSPGGEAHLPGVDQWIADQKRKAAAELLHRELESLQPSKEAP